MPSGRARSNARRSGCTMMLASHNMGEVERLCDEVIMLRAGLVVDQGSPTGTARTETVSPSDAWRSEAPRRSA